MVPLWWPELWDEVWLLDLHGIQGVHCRHRQTDRQTNTDKYTKHPGLTQGVQKAMVITKTNIPYSAFSKQNIWFSIWQFLFPHSWIWCWTQRREGTSVGSCQMVRVKASRQSKLHKIMISWTTYQISLHSITCFGWKFHLHHNSSKLRPSWSYQVNGVCLVCLESETQLFTNLSDPNLTLTSHSPSILGNDEDDHDDGDDHDDN